MGNAVASVATTLAFLPFSSPVASAGRYAMRTKVFDAEERRDGGGVKAQHRERYTRTLQASKLKLKWRFRDGVRATIRGAVCAVMYAR